MTGNYLSAKYAVQMGRCGILYPELEGSVMMEIETADSRAVSPYHIDADDLKIIKEEIYPYWKDKKLRTGLCQQHATGNKTFLLRRRSR